MVISYSWFRTVFIHDCFEEIDRFIDCYEPNGCMNTGGEAMTMNSHTRFILLQVFQSVGVYGFSQKRRGDRSKMYHLFEKDRDTHESEAGEKPQKL